MNNDNTKGKRSIKGQKEDGNLERLHKVMACSGVASRRKAERMIMEGQVTVNGEVVMTLGMKVDPKSDVVSVNGLIIDPEENTKIYIVMNKPRGVLTTCYDPEGRSTVMDLIREFPQRIFPVGRLDYLSEGLLILTNDGEFANKLIHPRFNISKVYEVKVFGTVSEAMLKVLRAGVKIDNKLVRPKSVRVIKHLPNKTWLEFRLAEGKNREIRRFCEASGLTIDKLKRVAIEGLSIDGISPGRFQVFSKNVLLRHLGLDKNGDKTPETGLPAHPMTAYVSPKKTVKFKEHKLRGISRNGRGKLKEADRKDERPVSADDKKFMKYRKKNYQKTMEFYKNNEPLEPEIRKVNYQGS